MRIINHLRWLRHVVENIVGTPLAKRCALIGPNNCIRLKISFDVPIRWPFRSSMSLEPTLVVSIVGWGSPSMVRTSERTAMKNCLEQISANGYFAPNYSYFLIKAVKEGESVTTTAERLCRVNQHDMVWSIFYFN
jgi:hypothetical protein